MLQINMADVMNVIGSLTPYLIAIGVLFALALIITFAVNKKTVKDVATRKIVHSESWLVALVGIVVAVSMMLTGPLSTLLNNATTTKYMLSDTTVSKANELAKDDIQMINFMIDSEMPFIIALTKCDKLNKSERKKREEAFMDEIPCADQITMIWTSTETGEGIADLKEIFEELADDEEDYDDAE